MPVESDPYSRFTRRIISALVVIAALGTGAATYRGGWKFGLGFLLGAGMSYLSFWRWQKLVESLGAQGTGRSASLLLVRFGVLVAAAYGIVKYLEVNPMAVFLGLLVSAAAVIVSILFELFYAGT